ncbi:hypothetical protein D3C71_2252750 [compost metagenome]
MPNPKFFHRSLMITVGRNRTGSPRKKIGFVPKTLVRKWLMPPSSPRMSIMMPAIVTQDRKCGR